MLRSLLVTLALGGWFLAVSSAQAQQLIRPERSLSPADVIRIQLEALSANGRGDDMTGIEQVWAFAHPDNRRLTGPLPRFARMLRSPSYLLLLGNRGHRIERVSVDDGSAHFAVRVTSRDGGIYGYSWRLSRTTDGAAAGAWMTTSVALVGRLGEAI
jgi:hypothetical protein